MTSDKTAILGGIIILAGGLSLAVYANLNAEALSQAKANTVSKYISLSEKALTSGDHHQAEKFVIKALQTDPKNKQAIAAFKKVEISGYAPMVEGGSNANGTTPQASPASQPKKPSPQSEGEEEMGCI